MVYTKTRDKPIAAISGLMVLASNFIYHVGPLYRQHMTMVLFELLAVIAISKYDDPKHGKRYIVLSMLALLAAGYTKQLSVATVAAVLFFLFLRSPKKAIVAGFGLAVVAGGIFLLIDLATQGQWFLNTMTANANAYDYRQALDLYRQFFTLHFFTVALAIGYSFYRTVLGSPVGLHDLVRLCAGQCGAVGQVGRGRIVLRHGDCGVVRGLGLAVVKLKESLAIKRPRAALDREFRHPPALSRAGLQPAASAHRRADLRPAGRSHRRGARRVSLCGLSVLRLDRLHAGRAICPRRKIPPPAIASWR